MRQRDCRSMAGERSFKVASSGGLAVAESGNAALSLVTSCSTWAGLSITQGLPSASCRSLPDPSRGPVPGQQVVEALGRMVGQAPQDVSQPGARVDGVELGRLDQGVDLRRT